MLTALHLALGGRVADVDDFTVGSPDEPEIDVIMAPIPPTSASDEQAFDDDVGRALGKDVQIISETPFRGRFAWRTHIRRSAEVLGARSEFKIMTFDPTSNSRVERGAAKDLGRGPRAQVQGILYDRLLGADGGSLRPHPVTLVAEPEAHLHPQAASE